MDNQGILLCAKYAVSPNFFGYCGPDKNLSLVDHLKENVADDELMAILADFETLFPYLQLIARQNKINNPFDYRVVEAYWLGNEFLKPSTALEYEAFARERLSLGTKLSKNDFLNLKLKINRLKFVPHHAFHVFNIFKRTGRDSSFHTIKTMDECRIGWGRIIKNQKLKIKNYNEKSKINSVIVETKTLIIKGDQLALSKPKVKELKIDYKGKIFVNNLNIGDWVSFHWGFVCDKLTAKQATNLEFYTKKAIDFYNL